MFAQVMVAQGGGVFNGPTGPTAPTGPSSAVPQKDQTAEDFAIVLGQVVLAQDAPKVENTRAISKRSVRQTTDVVAQLMLVDGIALPQTIPAPLPITAPEPGEIAPVRQMDADIGVMPNLPEGFDPEKSTETAMSPLVMPFGVTDIKTRSTFVKIETAAASNRTVLNSATAVPDQSAIPDADTAVVSAARSESVPAPQVNAVENLPDMAQNDRRVGAVPIAADQIAWPVPGQKPNDLAVKGATILPQLVSSDDMILSEIPVAPSSRVATEAPSSNAYITNAVLLNPVEIAFHMRVTGSEPHGNGADIIGLADLSAAVGSTQKPAPFATRLQTSQTDAASEPIISMSGLLPTDQSASDVVAQPIAVPADLPKPIQALLQTPSAPQPVTWQPLPATVSADLVVLSKTRPDGPVEILLNPSELGNLRFEIHQKGDQVRLVLSVERPETLDLFRRNTDQLLAEFRQAGFSGASLSFGQWDHQGGFARPTPAPTPPAQPLQDDWMSNPAPVHVFGQNPEIAPQTGLNIRL